MASKHIPCVEERFREARENITLLDRIFNLEAASADADLGHNTETIQNYNEALRRVCEQTLAHLEAVEKALDEIKGYSLPAPDVEAA